jgi:hypothetical protein
LEKNSRSKRGFLCADINQPATQIADQAAGQPNSQTPSQLAGRPTYRATQQISGIRAQFFKIGKHNPAARPNIERVIFSPLVESFFIDLPYNRIPPFTIFTFQMMDIISIF